MAVELDSSPVEDNIDDKAMNFSNSRAAKKEHDKIAAWTLNQFRAIRNARNTTERQWYLNLAFFFGKQNVQLLKSIAPTASSSFSTRLHVPAAPYWRVRPVINKVRSTVRTELSHLTGNRPNASVVPASAEDRDMYAAMAGEQIWENQYTDKNIKAVLRRAMWWTLTTGTGFIKTYWDHTKKGAINPETGMPDIMGDIVYTHETPFHVLCPDLRQEDLEVQPFLIHASVRSVEFAKMNFKTDLTGEPLEFKDSNSTQDVLEDSYLNLTGTQTLNHQNTVMVLEVWVKPGQHPMFPEGAFYTMVDNKIVQGQQGWPFQHGMYPFSKFDHIPAGKFYSTSLIEDLIPLQKEYNRTRGQIIEAKNRMAKLQLIAPRGSVDASKITTEPGQIIFYTPGFAPPSPLPLQALPSYVIQELDRINTDWNDIAGQHEVSKGQVPPGVTAATAISYLQERDESKLSPTFDSLEEGIQKMAQMTLSYAHEFWDMPRLVKVTGPDGSFDAMAFKGSDLGNNLDIRIEAGSSLPTSKAAKQALIMDLMKMGFIDPQKGLEVIDMGGINKIYEQIQVDQRQAQRENLRMSKVTSNMMEEFNANNAQMMAEDPAAFEGMAPPIIQPVNSWDNHKLHIEYHNNFRKGQSFETLAPETKALFEEHVRQHVEALGMESVTMNPRAAAGLPPELPVDPSSSPQDNSGGNPGPDPMPENSLEGQVA